MDDAQLFFFYLSHGLVPVFEIKISHMGKISGNPKTKLKVLKNGIFCMLSFSC